MVVVENWRDEENLELVVGRTATTMASWRRISNDVVEDDDDVDCEKMMMTIVMMLKKRMLKIASLFSSIAEKRRR